MKTLERRKDIDQAGRGLNRCPVCGWRFRVDEDWQLDEMFCGLCETRLIYSDDGKCRRWMAAGIYWFDEDTT